MANRRVVTIQRTSKDIKLMWLAGKVLVWGSFPLALLASLFIAPETAADFFFQAMGIGLMIVWTSMVRRWWHHS